MKHLYIETNHGFVDLKDVTIEERPRTWGDRLGTYKVAVGTVVASAETSRLFGAHSTKEVYPKDSKVGVAIYRQPYCTGISADTWRVSIVTCG